MSRRTTVVATVAFALVLLGWGAVRPATGPAKGSGAAPAVLSARVAVINPVTGALVWTSVGAPRHFVLDTTTGRAIPPGS